MERSDLPEPEGSPHVTARDQTGRRQERRSRRPADRQPSATGTRTGRSCQTGEEPR